MDDLKGTVPYIVFEGEMTRAERTIHRLWISTILLLLALLGTNAGWLYYESSFEDIVVTQESDRGYNNFVGNDGDIINGIESEEVPDAE